MLGIGTPGNSYYIFKWQDYYLFPEIRYVQNKENDVVNNIGYYSVFLDKVFIPENLKLYENNRPLAKVNEYSSNSPKKRSDSPLNQISFVCFYSGLLKS